MPSLMRLASVAALLCAVSLAPVTVDAHSFLVKPEGRDKGPRTDESNSMGCPSNTKGKVTSFQAGEKIDVRYWRNNHLGGFIRWSIVPSGKESKAAFDQNAFFYTCRESGATCLPKGQNSRYAGDSSGDNTISCGDTITLPDWLPAGDYTLQWMWFGVGSSYGNLGWAEPQFKSCADLRLTTSGTKTKAPSCPTFIGGDRVTKLENLGNDKCFYFHSTAIASSQYKGDNNKAKEDYKFGIPADVEKCGGGAAAGGDDDDDDDDGSGAASAGNSTAPATTTQAPAPATTPRAPTPTRTPRAPTPARSTKAPTTEAPEPTATTKAPTTDAPEPKPSTTAPAASPAATTKAPVAEEATLTPAPSQKCGVKRN